MSSTIYHLPLNVIDQLIIGYSEFTGKYRHIRTQYRSASQVLTHTKAGIESDFERR